MAGYVNEVKKLRAIKILKDEARLRGENVAKFEPDEAKLEELYLNMGGLFIEESEVKTPNEPIAATVMRRNRLQKRVRETEEDEDI